MGKFSIKTGDLLSLLTVLLHTSDKSGCVPSLCGIHMYMEMGYYKRDEDEGDDVGLTQLLCGMSTNSHVAGALYCPAEGSLGSGGMFIPNAAAKAIIGTYRDINKEKEGHILQFDVDETAGKVVVTEYGVVDGVEIHFSYDPSVEFPVHVVKRWLQGGGAPMRDDAGDPVPDGDVVTFLYQDREAILKVEKALKSDARFRKEHRGSVVQVGIGDYWRGGVLPSEHTKNIDPHDLEAEMVMPGEGVSS